MRVIPLLALMLLVVTVEASAEVDHGTFEVDRGDYQVFVRKPNPPSLKGLSKLLREGLTTTLVVYLLYPATVSEKVAIRNAVHEIKAHLNRATAMDASVVNAVIMIGKKEDKPNWKPMYFFPGNQIQVQLWLKTGGWNYLGRRLELDAKK